MSPGLVALVEGVKGVIAHPWRSLTVILLVSATASGAAVTDLLTQRAALEHVERLRAQGADVLVVHDEDGELRGRDCERVSRVSGVRAAGGSSAATVVRLDDVPGSPFRMVTATPGYLRVVLPELRLRASTAVVVGPDVLLDVGLTTGSPISLGDRAALRGQVAARQVRAPDRRRWLTVLDPAPVRVHECWIEADPGSSRAVERTLAALFPGARELRIVHLVSPQAVDAATRSAAERPSRWSWAMAAVGAGTAVSLLVAARRTELALYRILSAPRSLVLLIAFTEAWILALAGIVLSVLTTFAVGGSTGPLSAPLVSTVLANALASLGLVGSIVAVAAAAVTSANPARLIRARQ